MNPRILNNLFLALVLFVLVVFYLYKSNQTTEQLILSSLNLDEITLITIPKDKRADLVFKKNAAGEWLMTSPYKVHAHQFRINTLLKLSQVNVDKKYNIDDLNLADYALDKPRARIIFNQTEIAFGKTNPLNNRRYLMAENNLLLINDMSFPLVSAQAASFVDLQLLPKNASVTSIEINNEQYEQANIIKAWQAAKAFSVHRYLARKNLGLIKINMKNQHITFEITDDEPWLILARVELGIEYHLDKSLKDALLGIDKISQPDA